MTQMPKKNAAGSADLNNEVRQKHLPSEADMARHPTMHRTDTLDCLTCVRGDLFGHRHR